MSNTVINTIKRRAKEKESRQSRYSKGCVIAASRKILKVHGEDAWVVESETTDGKYYKVTIDGCQCLDSQTRGNICKHQYAVIRMGV
jgi:hypothetical protein